MLKAIASSPTDGVYTVIICQYSEQEYRPIFAPEGTVKTAMRRDYSKPILEIPAQSYDHAQAIVKVYNNA